MKDILPGVIGNRPLREANTRGPQLATGTILSLKMDHSVAWVGLHERRFAIHVEIDRG